MVHDQQQNAVVAGPPQTNGIAGNDFVLAIMLRKLALCTVYIAVSTALIRFNKHLMQENYFPFSLALSAIHMIFATILCSFLYTIRPSMFPAMDYVRDDKTNMVKWFTPIGVFFAIMLYGSNQAYLYCSVALLQFMKEANVMIVFLISCAVGLQVLNRVRMALIMWVIVAATISVSGDMRFSLVGIAFQAMSQLAECARVVLGEFLLSDRKLDPLTYTAFMAPVCLVFLLIGNVVAWNPAVISAALSHWRLLIANASLAFLLNVLVATVIKEVSAVGFVLTGLTKDIAIVVLSCALFGDSITRTQALAFFMTLAGVGMWALLKIAPDSQPVQLLKRSLCMPITNKTETVPLMACKKV